MQKVGSNYLAEALIGTGATGDVWRGTDQEGAPVAIKILHAEYSRRRDVIHRFIQERDLLTEIQHPHVVNVHDLVYDRSTLAIVMDLIEGGDLSMLLLEQGPLGLEHTRRISADMAKGLAAIHAADIVHLDLKPGNVLLRRDRTEDQDVESALIADLGVSQLAQGPTGVAEHPRFGTPQYTAPEIVTGGTVGSAADIYALGLLMIEMLEGRPVFGTTDPEDVFAILHAQTTVEPERPKAADDTLWTLISSMVDKDPEERPTAAEVALDLGVTPAELDTSALRGATSALGEAVPPRDGEVNADDDSGAGPDGTDTTRTVDLGHRTSILRSAQTVRLGARGSHTIALPLGLQPGAEDGAPGAGASHEPNPDAARQPAPRHRRRAILALVLVGGVLLGALSVGAFLSLRGPGPTPTDPTSSATDGSIEVPDLAGMDEHEARTALGDEVEVDVVSVPGESGQDGVVQGTRPGAGERVMPGELVTLEIAEELATQPLSALPANTAGGRAGQGAVTVGGASLSDVVKIQGNTDRVEVTYMLQQRYIAADTDLVVPDDGTAVRVSVEVDGTSVMEQDVQPGEVLPVTADVTGAQRLTFTVTAADESSTPSFAFSDGVLGGEAGTVPGT